MYTCVRLGLDYSLNTETVTRQAQHESVLRIKGYKTGYFPLVCVMKSQKTSVNRVAV